MHNTRLVSRFVSTLFIRRKPLLLLFWLLFISAGQGTFPSDDFPTGQRIDIVFDTDPDMFPRTWYSKRVDAHAESLPVALRTKAKNILNDAIAKYPEDVLFNNLRKIYILKSLRFFGVPYGATNRKDVIYLTYDAFIPEATPVFVEGFFHHEFSSILFRKYAADFNPCDWICFNPPDFRYGEGGIDAIKRGEASLEFDYDLVVNGFLNKYAQSAMEEDINVFAQNLFSGGDEFWFIVDSFAPIRQKTSVIIAFYHRIDSRFTEEYFRSLALSH